MHNSVLFSEAVNFKGTLPYCPYQTAIRYPDSDIK